MKQNLILAAAVLMAIGCGAPKQVATTETVPSGATQPQASYQMTGTPEFQEVYVPLSEPQFMTDTTAWRAVQSGKSTDLSIAKKIAVQNARTELASTVQGFIKAVIENYARNTLNGENNEAMSQYQELARTVVSQKLSGSGVVAEKVLKDIDQYVYFVCVEMPKEAVKDEVAEQLAQEQKKILEVEFNRAQFEKVYLEEMARFEAAK